MTAPERPDPERAYRLLRHFLTQEGDGFRFALAVVDDSRERVRLMERLAADVAGRGMDLLTLDLADHPDDVILLRALMDLLAAHPAREGRLRAVQVRGLERHLDYAYGGSRPKTTGLLATANLQRDVFPDRCPVPLVLWISSLAQPALAYLAPDLWHWRTGRFDLHRSTGQTWAETLEIAAPRPKEGWERPPVESLQRRKMLLEELLAADPPPTEEQKRGYLEELGIIFQRLGELDAAEECFRVALSFSSTKENQGWWASLHGRIADILVDRSEFDQALDIYKNTVLPIFTKIGDIHSFAVTLGKIADIKTYKGKFQESLYIYENEVLPLFKVIGDKHSIAITIGKIADSLMYMNNYENALKIYKNEALPIFEKLGDIRSKYITLGKIADILTNKGNYDEALFIRKEELSVYENIGDSHSRAVVLGKIADILTCRGDFDGALRIREKEELPVYERLGDVRSRAVTLGEMGELLLKQDPEQNRSRAEALLREALEVFTDKGLAPDIKAVRSCMDHYGITP